jgi:hypothetical protein
MMQENDTSENGTSESGTSENDTRECEKLTDDRRQVMAKAYCLWQDELTKGQATTYKTYT